ncbi:unnamed protein product [Effrenium voratum]|nr:unnamed protein product [Effrenium voratum]
MWDVLDEVAETRAHFDLGNVWSHLAPGGNVYRLISLQQMRLAHCADLQAQLEDLAEEYAQLLGKDQPPLERRNALLLALQQTQVVLTKKGKDEEASWDDEVLQTKGFPPLEEFLVGDVSSIWPYAPRDPRARQSWFTAHVVAIMVAVVQTLGPMMVVLSLWEDPSNYLRTPLATLERLSVANVFCETRPVSDWCTIVMGVIFSFFVVVQLLNYALQELEDVGKDGRLAGCTSIWQFAGEISRACATAEGQPTNALADFKT